MGACWREGEPAIQPKANLRQGAPALSDLAIPPRGEGMTDLLEEVAVLALAVDGVDGCPCHASACLALFYSAVTWPLRQLCRRPRKPELRMGIFSALLFVYSGMICRLSLPRAMMRGYFSLFRGLA
jgi:hypothetical protein